MKNQYAHIIEKISLELSTKHMETADKLKNDMSIVLKNSVLPQMEQLFDKYDYADSALRINILYISINISTFKNYNSLKDEIIRQILDKLNSALKDYHKKSDYKFQQIKKRTANKNDEVQFLSVQENSSINITAESKELSELKRYSSLQIPESLKSIKNRKDSDGKTENVEKVDVEKRAEEIFLFFLQHGFLPWYGTKNEVYAFIENENWQKNIENSNFIEELVFILGSNQWAATRFSMLMESSKMLDFFEKINPKIEKTEVFIPGFIKRLPKEFRLKFTEFILFISVNQPATVVFQSALDLVVLLNSIEPDEIDFDIFGLKNNIISLVIDSEQFLSEEKSSLIRLFLKKEEDREINEKEIVDSELILENNEKDKQKIKTELLESMLLSKDVESVYVSKAGLILLHPFLKQFFRYAEFLDANDKIKNDSITPAVQILSYLSDGSESFFEADMLFCKFLCGIPLKMPVSVESILTKQIKEEAENLLKEVIRNWPALKNSSPNDLRNLFLQRDGKLVKQNGNFKLIVERKAQDVLLERLGWGISVVKIPWIDALVYVEW